MLPNSSAQILVYGSNSPTVEGQSDLAYLTGLQKDAHQHHIAYESLKGSRYAYSYLTPQGQIAYDWVIVKHGNEYHLEFTYSKPKKATFDPIIKQMTESFKVQ